MQSGTYLLPGLVEQGLEIPYGITPRLILPYITRQALYGRRKVILGKKLLHFVRKLGLTPCSKSYRTVLRQVVNLATCQIVVSNMSTDTLAVRVETDVYNVTGKLRYSVPRPIFDFSMDPTAFKTAAGSAFGYEEWMEGEPTFTLSHDFYEFVRGRAVPINYAHLLHFVRSPRRMDLYTWLSYRTYRIGPRGIKIPLAVLRHQFAPDLSQNSCKNFRRMLQRDLDVIRAVHSGFKVQLTRDALILFDSEPPVPRIPERT